jgi:Ty3 transposon capsid-like protein
MGISTRSGASLGSPDNTPEQTLDQEPGPSFPLPSSHTAIASPVPSMHSQATPTPAFLRDAPSPPPLPAALSRRPTTAPSPDFQVEHPLGEPTSRPPSSLHSSTRDPILFLQEQMLAQQQQLQQTILALQAAQTPPKPVEPKVKEPDAFTGFSREKLPTFLAQCQIVFATQPSRYSTETSKVMYAGSHLTDIAYEWFHPQASIPNYPNFATFKLFSQALESMFGDPDAVATAERRLRRLRMQENATISRYLIDFARYAAPLSWNDEVLCSQFYLGLAERIKDQIALQGKPKTLAGMRMIAQTVDARHWERHYERIPTSAPQTSVATPVATHQPRVRSVLHSQPNLRSPSSSTSQTTRTYPSQVPHHPASGSPSKFTPKQTFPANQVLGPDGKLLPSERERRVQAGLCLYCGKPGHSTTSCPKRTPGSYSNHPKTAPSAPKQARVAKVDSQSGKDDATL